MRGFTQFAGGARRTTLLALSALLALLVVAGVRDVPPAHAQTGNVTITKQVVDATGNAVAGNLSGYVFTLTPTGGGAAQTLPPTNAQGQTTAQVAVGSYTPGEQARSGAVLIGFFTEGVPTVSFSVTANQTTALTARNRVAGTATIAFSKSILDANGNPVGGDRSGFQFTISGPNGFNQTVTTDPISFASLGNLAASTYTITEQPRAGFTFESFRIRGITVPNGATVTLADGETVAVLVVNRVAAATNTVTPTTPPPTDAGSTTTEPLVAGCNLVVLTWPVGTELRVVVGATTGDLATIWTYDNATAAFRGFSTAPGAEVANNFRAVDRRLQPAYLCMRTAGTLVRPNP